MVTTIYYPAQPGGAPDSSNAPYPLIVFAHGFGGSPALYSTLLRDWASAGYVVAAPLFPLTGQATPGGPDLADYLNQPGDMEFVASEVLKESSASSGVLSGLVDARSIGAAGHSLGGVTTLGLVANTCCRDAHIGAAVVIAGDPIEFGSGRPEYSGAPPILLVHGDDDQIVPYVSSIEVYNSASPPKGLLTIRGGSHSAGVDPSGAAFTSVVRATTDFFDLYLKHDSKALRRMKSDASSSSTHLVFVASTRSGEPMKLPTPPTHVNPLRVYVVPSRGLADGQTVSVSWEGYLPGKEINVLECSKDPPSGPNDCDLATAKLFQPDPQGEGSLPFVVNTGPVGAGTCDAEHDKCVILVNEGSSSSPSASAIATISFGGGKTTSARRPGSSD